MEILLFPPTLRLFAQLVFLLRDQYGQPGPAAVRSAYHAARAGADMDRIVRLELEWWILHRERKPELMATAKLATAR